MEVNETTTNPKIEELIKTKVKQLFEELQTLKNDLENEINELQTNLLQSQNDVAQLEKTGNEHDLAKAKDTLEANQTALANAKKELQNVTNKIVKLNEQLGEYGYHLEDNHNASKENDRQQALAKIQANLAELVDQEQQIYEAKEAGQDVLKSIEEINVYLNKASTMGYLDMFSRNSFFIDMLKYRQLDNAQTLINELQGKLQNFTRELADVHLSAQVDINISGFERFADYWMDNAFTDFMVLQHISQAQQQISNLNTEVENIMTMLNDMSAKVTRLKAEAEANYAKLTKNC